MPAPPGQSRDLRWALRHPHKALRLALNWLHDAVRRMREPTISPPVMGWRPRAPQAGIGGRVILLASDLPPLHDEQSSDLRLNALIDLLGGRGRSMVFASRLARSDFPHALLTEAARARREAAFKAAGVVGFAYGADEVDAMMAALGPDLRHAFLSSAQVAHDFIPCVRSHCPTATIVYDMVDFHAAGIAREHDADPAVSAQKIAAIELAAVRAADITIVRSNEEKSAVLDLVPTAVVEVLPDIVAAKVMDLFHA